MPPSSTCRAVIRPLSAPSSALRSLADRHTRHHGSATRARSRASRRARRRPLYARRCLRLNSPACARLGDLSPGGRAGGTTSVGRAPRHVAVMQTSMGYINYQLPVTTAILSPVKPRSHVPSSAATAASPPTLHPAPAISGAAVDSPSASTPAPTPSPRASTPSPPTCTVRWRTLGCSLSPSSRISLWFAASAVSPQ